MPVIGVAKPDWTVEQLRARAQQSVAAHGGLDAEAFAKLATRLSYVAGDYQDPATFDKLRAGARLGRTAAVLSGDSAESVRYRRIGLGTVGLCRGGPRGRGKTIRS